MPRSLLDFDQAKDAEFTSQLELDQVKDNNASPAEFVPSTMNNWELWKRITSAEQRANGGNFTFYTPGPPGLLDPYVEIRDRTWKAFATFIFRGTSVWTPTSAFMILSRSKSNGTSSVRLYDVGNNNVIMTYTYSSQTEDLYEVTTFTNLPTNEAIIELQAQRSASNAGTTRVHAIGLYP